MIIGLMASVLLKRVLKKGSSIDQLFELQAEELSTEEEKARFLASRVCVNRCDLFIYDLPRTVIQAGLRAPRQSGL